MRGPFSPIAARLGRHPLLFAASMLLLRPAALWPQDDTPLPGGRMLRGTVTATAAGSLTVRNEDGDSYEVLVTPNTRFVRSRQPATFKDIHVGDGVGAGGVMDPAKHTLHAAFVGAIDADEVRRAQADLGKTYILGRITAIDLDGLRLTVHRPDNVTQVIGVDESTSFRRGGRADGQGGGPPAGEHPGAQRQGDAGDSITLADIKVGESIAARGALKGKLFVPTELHVFSGDRTHRRADPAAAENGGSHP